MVTLPLIEKTITDSSLLTYVKWEQSTNDEPYPLGNLVVNFRASNLIYTFVNVPYDVANALVTAQSSGQYFSKNIKNAYTFTK